MYTQGSDLKKPNKKTRKRRNTHYKEKEKYPRKYRRALNIVFCFHFLYLCISLRGHS